MKYGIDEKRAHPKLAPQTPSSEDSKRAKPPKSVSQV